MMMPRNSFGFSLFDDMFNDPFFKKTDTSLMKTDVQEKDGNYVVDVDLPGFAKEDIHADLKDGYLTISAEKNESNDEKDKKGNYIRKERYTGKCQRTFYVGEGIKEEDTKAAYKDGTLKLVFPKIDAKKLETQKKYITIE